MTEAAEGEDLEAAEIAAAISLGEFYMQCVSAFDIETDEEMEAAGAWLILQAAGIDVPVDEETDFTQPLRQRHVYDLSRLLGLKVAATDPERLFTGAQVEAYLLHFREHFRLPFMLEGEPAP